MTGSHEGADWKPCEQQIMPGKTDKQTNAAWARSSGVTSWLVIRRLTVDGARVVANEAVIEHVRMLFGDLCIAHSNTANAHQNVARRARQGDLLHLVQERVYETERGLAAHKAQVVQQREHRSLGREERGRARKRQMSRLAGAVP